jgi:hypothetical protein
MMFPRFGLSSWHTIVLGLAVELAFENAGLVFVSVVTERRWRERVLVVVPVAAFVWMMGTVRRIQIQLTAWSSYFALLGAYYPTDPSLLSAQTLQDYQHVVDGVNRLGWTAVLVTEMMVLLGGMLLLRWGSAVEWWGRTPMSKARLPDEDARDAGEFDVTVEPL